jgi:hypothetical protein
VPHHANNVPQQQLIPAGAPVQHVNQPNFGDHHAPMQPNNYQGNMPGPMQPNNPQVNIPAAGNQMQGYNQAPIPYGQNPAPQQSAYIPQYADTPHVNVLPDAGDNNQNPAPNAPVQLTQQEIQAIFNPALQQPNNPQQNGNVPLPGNNQAPIPYGQNPAPPHPARIPNAAAGNGGFFNQPANGNEVLYDPDTRGDDQEPVYPINQPSQQQQQPEPAPTEDSFMVVSATPYNGPHNTVVAQNQGQWRPGNLESFQEAYPQPAYQNPYINHPNWQRRVREITKCTRDATARRPRNSYFMYTDDDQHIYAIRVNGEIVCATDAEIQYILANGIPDFTYIRDGIKYYLDYAGRERITRSQL